jgi:hypothetical protein
MDATDSRSKELTSVNVTDSGTAISYTMFSVRILIFEYRKENKIFNLLMTNVLEN